VYEPYPVDGVGDGSIQEGVGAATAAIEVLVTGANTPEQIDLTHRMTASD